MKKFSIGLLFTVFACISLHAEHFLTYIIPCYNCERWVGDAIESIYRQNLSCPFEIVCTDDGSQDNTYEVLLSLQKVHPEISIFRHETNKGGACARNTCVQNSHGDLIFCLDSDNFLEENTVQLLIDHMDITGHDIVAFGALQYFVLEEEEGEEIIQPTELAPYSLKHEYYRFKDLFREAATPPWSGNYLYTRKSFEQVGGYPEGLTIDTFAFGFLQLYHYFKMSYVPNTYYWHRHGIDSYYIRASRNHRINLDFFDLLLKYKHVFTEKSIEKIEEELAFFRQNQKWNVDVIGMLEGQHLKLNKQFRIYPKIN